LQSCNISVGDSAKEIQRMELIKISPLKEPPASLGGAPLLGTDSLVA
jgi:hypothetical protein